MAKRELPKEFFANSGGEVFRDRAECEISFGTGEVTRYVQAPEGSVVLTPIAQAVVRKMVDDLCVQAKRYGSLLSMDASEDALRDAKESYEEERDLLLARLTAEKGTES